MRVVTPLSRTANCFGFGVCVDTLIHHMSSLGPWLTRRQRVKRLEACQIGWLAVRGLFPAAATAVKFHGIRYPVGTTVMMKKGDRHG